MRDGDASKTAVGAAGHRAAHQLLEGGAIFADPFAQAILGDAAEEALERARNEPRRSRLRLFIAARSRFAEDAARAAIADGVRQVVALGARLDTFALRLEPVEGLTFYEVDHPATQAEKRRRLDAAGLVAPEHCRFVAVDFAKYRPTAALNAAGFDPHEPSFFSWLGVTPCLTPEAIVATLAEVAALPGGVEIVFDYIEPERADMDDASRRAIAALSARVAATDEPFRGRIKPGWLHAEARKLGFSGIDDIGAAKIAARYFPDAERSPRGGAGPHFVRLVMR